MRKFLMIAAIAFGCTATVATAQVAVRGYFKRDGTYVAPSVRSAPNSTTLDNYSTKPNYNPYTGKTGTVDPYAAPVYRPYTPSPSTVYRAPAPYQPYKAPCYFNCK